MAGRVGAFASAVLLAVSLVVALLILAGPEDVQSLLVRLVAAVVVVLFGLFFSLLVYGMLSGRGREVEGARMRVEEELERIRRE